jgi:hypothetical protein
MQAALRLALAGLLALAVSGPLRQAHAQETGPAILTAPLPGATLSGVVAILGTAAHPRFQRYELAFGYDPDPTDTWFSIQEPVTTPMPAGLLGRWDTTAIADGLYVLRLRVYTSDREYIETLVRGVRVQNQAPTPPPATIPPATSLPAAPGTPAVQVQPTATAPLIALPPAPTARPTAGAGGNLNQGRSAGAGLSAQALSVAFGAGVQLTVVLFALLGAYLAMRAAAQAILRRLRR